MSKALRELGDSNVHWSFAEASEERVVVIGDEAESGRYWEEPLTTLKVRHARPHREESRTLRPLDARKRPLEELIAAASRRELD